MGRAHEGTGVPGFLVAFVDHERMVNDVVNVLHQNAAHVREIHEHAFVGHARYIDDIALDFGFKPVAMTVQMSAFRFVIGYTVARVGFYVSSYGCGHASSPSWGSKFIEAELMQYRSPP
jgi:hypothetical protein